MNSPPSSSLLAKATAWMRMSRLPVGLPPAGEDALDVLVALHVAGLHEGGPELLGQRTDPLLDEHLHRREADRGTLAVERLGDAPGDGVVVGQAEDQGALALQQTHQLRTSLRRPRTTRVGPTVVPAAAPFSV